jgi:hypothetical protein
MKDSIVPVLLAILSPVITIIALMWVGFWVAKGVQLAGGLGV